MSVIPKTHPFNLLLSYQARRELDRLANHFRHSGQGVIDLALVRFDSDSSKPSAKPRPVRMNPVLSAGMAERLEELHSSMKLSRSEIIRRAIHQLAERENQSVSGTLTPNI